MSSRLMRTLERVRDRNTWKDLNGMGEVAAPHLTTGHMAVKERIFWLDRYAVLDSGLLRFYRNPMDFAQKAKETLCVDLSTARIQLKEERRRYRLSVPGAEPLYVKLQHARDVPTWSRMFRAHLNYAAAVKREALEQKSIDELFVKAKEIITSCDVILGEETQGENWSALRKTNVAELVDKFHQFITVSLKLQQLLRADWQRLEEEKKTLEEEQRAFAMMEAEKEAEKSRASAEEEKSSPKPRLKHPAPVIGVFPIPKIGVEPENEASEASVTQLLSVTASSSSQEMSPPVVVTKAASSSSDSSSSTCESDDDASSYYSSTRTTTSFAPTRRTVLPSKVLALHENTSLFRLMLEMARSGKTPLSLLEPLSAVQWMCESLEYSQLLDAVCAETTQRKRMALMVGFIMSRYPSTASRVRKPFTPIASETYEWDRWDEPRGCRFLAECVAKPTPSNPICATYAEGKRGWVVSEIVAGSVKVGRSSVDLCPAPGTQITVELPEYQETYSWNRIPVSVQGITSPASERKISHSGTVAIRCSNGLSAQVHFEKEGPKSVSGTLCEGSRTTRITGRWDSDIWVGPDCVFKPDPLPSDSPDYYGFSMFARQLNELEVGDADRLPPTDSRFRRDIRALEEGDLETCTAQRQAYNEAARKPDASQFSPKWFEKTGDNSWAFNGQYWDSSRST